MFNATKLSTTQPRIYQRKKKQQKNNNDTRPKKNRTKKRAYSLDVLALWLRDRQSQHVFVRIWFKCSNQPTSERSRSRAHLLLHYISISTWCCSFSVSLCLLLFWFIFFHLLLRSPSFQPARVLLVNGFPFFPLRSLFLASFSLSHFRI